MTAEVSTIDGETEVIRVLHARIASLEAENASLKDDIAELEREMEYISRAKHTKRKKWDANEND